MFKEQRLKNGTELVTYHQPALATVTMMVLVKTGTMFERPEEAGIAHFLEHMCFKDTKNYTKEDLARELEMRGAVSNAFTSFECTAYYAKSTSEMYHEVFPLIAEIYNHPLFPEADIETEKGVVVGEINMYKDMPQSDIYYKHQEFLYGKGNPHGDSILGTIESVNSFTRDMIINFRSRYYVPENTTIMIAGNFNPDTVVDMCEQYFTQDNARAEKLPPATHQITGGNINLVVKESEQSHIIYSHNTVSLYDKEATLLDVLAAVLGQGFTSRLFKRLREKMGAGYYARAETDETFDAGALIISTGTEHTRVAEIILAINEECTKLVNEEISEAELKKVKDMTLARFVMGLESSSGIAEHYGVRAVLDLPKRDIETLKEELAHITVSDIQKCAQQYLTPETLLITVMGPASLADQIAECKTKIFSK